MAAPDPAKVLVLGGNGMLGSMVTLVLNRNPSLDVSATARDPSDAESPDGVSCFRFDASRDDVEAFLRDRGCSWIVNAIGVTNRYIEADSPETVARAIEVNAAFPHSLAAAAQALGQRVVQIATDGVFSGARGPYDESAPHDAEDVYGLSKSLGEVAADNVIQLRCSIVGDPEHSASLLGWAMSHGKNAEITGYTNHLWNGVTTWQFAKLCEAVILGAAHALPSPLHVVPEDSASKAELLQLAVGTFGRADIRVRPEPAEQGVNRILSTINADAN